MAKSKVQLKDVPVTTLMVITAFMVGTFLHNFDVRGPVFGMFGYHLFAGVWLTFACVALGLTGIALGLIGGVASRVGASRNKRSPVDLPAPAPEVSPAIEQLTTISNFRSAAANDSK